MYVNSFSAQIFSCDWHFHVRLISPYISSHANKYGFRIDIRYNNMRIRFPFAS